MLAVALAAFAGATAGPAAEPRVETDKADYVYASTDPVHGVRITFINGGTEVVYLANTAPYVIVNQYGPVATAIGNDQWIPIASGATYEGGWDFAQSCYQFLSKHPCAGAATPGWYQVQWSYVDSSANGHTVATDLAVSIS